MTWTCELTEARLSDYLDGLLEPAESHALNQHVNSCENCSLLFATVSRTLGGLYSLEVVEPPPRLVYAILNQTLGPRAAQTGWRSIFGWSRGFASLRFVYSAVALVATVVVLALGSSRKPKLSDFTPVNIYRSANQQAHLAYARSTKFVSDLRVVYEIQSRLNKDNDLPASPNGTVPQSAPGKNPGTTDGTKPGSPRQQNRANGLERDFQILASEFPLLRNQLCGQLLRRSIP